MVALLANAWYQFLQDSLACGHQPSTANRICRLTSQSVWFDFMSLASSSLQLSFEWLQEQTSQKGFTDSCSNDNWVKLCFFSVNLWLICSNLHLWCNIITGNIRAAKTIQKIFSDSKLYGFLRPKHRHNQSVSHCPQSVRIEWLINQVSCSAKGAFQVKNYYVALWLTKEWHDETPETS